MRRERPRDHRRALAHVRLIDRGRSYAASKGATATLCRLPYLRAALTCLKPTAPTSQFATAIGIPFPTR